MTDVLTPRRYNDLLIIMIYRGDIDIGKIASQDIPLVDRVKDDILKQVKNEK